jgi:ArsR family transcriptional regulator
MPVTADLDLGRTLARLKALADETRLQIVLLLAGGERCVCEIRDQLEIGQSLLSHHLRTLKDAGLVTDRRDGRWVHYSLDRDALSKLEAFVQLTRRARQSVQLSGSCRD